MQAIDVAYAYQQINSTVRYLKEIRDKSEAEFKKVFDDTTKLGRSLHGELFELKKPRTTGLQTQRSNVDVNSAEDYFRITLFDEFCVSCSSSVARTFYRQFSTWYYLWLDVPPSTEMH